MKKINCLIFLVLSCFSLISLSACESHNAADNIIRVGTVAGADEQLLQAAKQVANQHYGIDLQVVTFADYSLPNAALNDGSIDANIFQHQPYLTAAIAAQHYALAPIGKTFIFPTGIYSKNYKALTHIPAGAIIAIPNDPSNEARSLILLNKAGLLTLKPNIDTTATVNDIANNPQHYQFKELDAAQLPRTLQDVALAVINSNYAIPAGLVPTKDALLLEQSDSPYANLIVVREKDVQEPKLLKLVTIMHSAEVRQAAAKIFAGQAIPAN